MKRDSCLSVVIMFSKNSLWRHLKTFGRAADEAEEVDLRHMKLGDNTKQSPQQDM